MRFDCGSCESFQAPGLPYWANMKPDQSTRDGLVKSAAATLLFGLWHSVLASAPLKRQVKQRVGEEKAVAYYRIFYNVQALVATIALLTYVLRQPGKTLYEAKGGSKALLRFGQVVSIAYGAWAALQLPLTHFSGLPHLLAYLNGEKMPMEADTQGPTVESDGHIRDTGPFRWTRHPLNLAPLGVFWFQPKMTSNWATFCALISLYNVAGSYHEEKRLAKASPEFEDYRKRTSFFSPYTSQERNDT